VDLEESSPGFSRGAGGKNLWQKIRHELVRERGGQASLVALYRLPYCRTEKRGEFSFFKPPGDERRDGKQGEDLKVSNIEKSGKVIMHGTDAPSA